ncbi:hypothetical protein [Herbaspirillum sp. NPDC087042]|uniref:hypothetical protein n=1 Tax=Herbaspirillum sp. NPDC087042 TaxID=3364004 RepID=UPI0037FC4346
MSPSVFIQKVFRRFKYEFLLRGFFREPRPLLKFLFKLKLDIALFAVPYFISHNRPALRRLKELRKQGLNPAVIYFSTESDGRFERLYEISQRRENTECVWFQFPIATAVAETIIFREHSVRGCGFYEDARMKYIDPINDQARAEYRLYLERFLDALEKVTGKIDFFFSGSNHDRYVVEMINVAQKRGVEWVVAEREGTGTEYTYQNEAECYLNSVTVTADYFVVANEGHKHMFNFSRMPSVKDIFVIGELDTDWWFHWDRKFQRKEYREWDKYEKRVLFLTFGIRNYVSPYAFPDNPEFNWIELLAQAEDEVFEFACRHRDVLVFYKMGHVEDNNPLFLERCAKAGLTNVVPLDRSFSCNELILYSQLVIGFQTTAMYEAMFSNNPLFYIEWEIHPDIDRKTMLLQLADSGACTTIRSKDEFRTMLDRWAENDPQVINVSQQELDARVRTRETMFLNADGHVAERVWSKVIELIRARRARKA